MAPPIDEPLSPKIVSKHLGFSPSASILHRFSQPLQQYSGSRRPSHATSVTSAEYVHAQSTTTT